MAVAETSTDDDGVVVVYMDVYSPNRIPPTGSVSVVRDARARNFHFYDAFHGKVDTLSRQKANDVLSELIDQGHIDCPDTAMVVMVKNKYTSRIYADGLMRANFWVTINIKRESVELVSTRIFREAIYWLFLSPRFDRYSGLNAAFDQVVQRWKSSRQFVMESEKAAAGDGLSPPPHIINAALYDHQKQGLRWMLDREELPSCLLDELPPFWEWDESQGLYRCELTCFLTYKRPERLRGGILADEQGMGKTLTLLSLIAYTKLYNNNNNAEVGKKRKAEEEEEFKWRPTLIVCPPSVLATWKAQIKQFTCPGSLKVCVYNGKGKIRDPDVLRRHDLVLTTYHILAKEEEQLLNSQTLHQINWWRVVLDDAHVLKCSKKLHAASPFVNLKAERRWAVTGKPVHVDSDNYNLYPVMAFLQLQPLSDVAMWKRLMYSKFEGPRTRSLRLQILMDIIALRRTMPARFIENHLVLLSKDEQDLYNSMEAEARKAADFGLRPLQATVFHLWQSCNSIALCRLSCAEMVSAASFQDLYGEPKLLEKWVTVLQEERDYACPVCLDQPEDIVVTRCTHLFCKSCIMRIFERCTAKKSACPLCRRRLAKCDIFCSQSGPSVLQQMKTLMEGGSSSGSMSSKCSSLLSMLLKLRTEEPHRKPIVFSQFRRMLLLLEGVLSEAGFDVRRLDASDKAKTKAQKVEEFGNAESPMVLLISFKALSDTPGLDLSSGSNIYMMEPCWNARLEEEALGRIQRLGKKDGVNVVRFVCKNSIEERVLEMRKQKVVYGSLKSKREVNISDKKDFRQLLGL